MHRTKSRLAKLEGRMQAETDARTLVVVFDKNFYGNAHLLPPDAWGSEDEDATPKPGGEDSCETA